MALQEYQNFLKNINNCIEQCSRTYTEHLKKLQDEQRKALTLVNAHKRGHEDCVIKLLRLINEYKLLQERNNEQCKKLQQELDSEQTVVRDLEEQKNKLQTDLLRSQHKKQLLSEKQCTQNREKILAAKALIKSCKILTGANFVYDRNEQVDGYVFNSNTNAYNTFSLCSDAQQGNVEIVWAALKEVHQL